MKKEVITVFRFSFAMLKQLCDNMLQLIDRDIVEFTDRGFTLAKRAAFVAQLNTFLSIPSDETLDGMKQTATQNKDKARLAVEIAMRSIINMVQTVFKNFPGKQAEFGDFEISHQSDDELVRNAKLMKDSATKYLSDLASEGLTAAKITSFGTILNTFDTAIDLQKKAITDRNSSTENRRIEANKLYNILIEHSNRGKSIFADVSQAKYSDYVIYDTPSGTNEETTETPLPV